MNFNRLVLGVILLLSILTVSAVSANENVTSDNMTFINDNSVEITNDDNLKQYGDANSLKEIYDFDVRLDSQETPEYGRGLLLNVILPDDAGGAISYSVNAKKFSIAVDDLYFDSERYGEACIRVNAGDLKYGLNNLSFTYIGNDYPQKTVTKSYTLESNIKIENSYVGYGDGGYVTLRLPSDAEGNLTVYELIFHDLEDDFWGYGANFKLIASSLLINGFANVSVSGLNPGRHYIYANYTGSDYVPNFEFSYSSRSLEQAIYDHEYDAFIDIIPKINFPDKIYADNEYYIDFRLPETYNGILNVTVGGLRKSFTVKNGFATFKLFNIESASHGEGEELDYIKIKVNYTDDWHNFRFDEPYIIFVTKGTGPIVDFEITDYSKNILKGETNYVTLAFPEDSHGTLVSLLDGTIIGETLIDGSVYEYYLNTENLAIGFHNLLFKYSGEDNILKTRSMDFEVTYIDVDYPDVIEIGAFDWMETSNTISVRILDDATGTIKIIIDGKTVDEGVIVEGSYNFEIKDLSAKSHEFEVIYTGNYPTYTTKFTLNSTYKYDVDVDDVIYGQKNNITVKLPAGTTGVATLTIGDKIFDTDINANGEAIFEVEGLSPGAHDWILDYPGDNNFPAFKSKGSLNVIYRITTDADERDNIYNGESLTFTLVLPANAKGNLIISRYVEDSASFKVIKTQALVSGKAQVTFNDLNLGENEFKAVYSGTDYDVDEYRDVVYVINKIIEPENKGIIVGNNAEYEIQLEDPINDTLRVYIKTDGKYELIKQLNLVEGRAKVVLSNLAIGFYNVKFESGNGWSKEVYLSVDKAFSWKINPKIKLGNGNIFEAKLPSNASGVLYFVIYHQEYYASEGSFITMSLPYNGDFVAVPAVNFFVGEYRVLNFTFNDTVYGINNFSLDDGNLAKFVVENIASVHVTKKDTSLYIELPKDATGEIVVKIGDRNYIKTLDGGKATISGVPANLDRVVFSYVGCKLYSPITNSPLAVKEIVPQNIDPNSNQTSDDSSKITVNPKIIAANLKAVYNGGVYYSVKVYGRDSKPAKGVTLVFKLNGKKIKTVKTDSKGVGKVKLTSLPGTYKITSSALGISVVKTLTIKQVLKLKKVAPKKSAKKLVLTATLSKVNAKYLKGKIITFKFNGKVYKAKTNKKGIAKVTIKKSVLKKLKAGRFVTYQATYIKDTVKLKVKVQR